MKTIINKGIAWICAKHFLNFLDDETFLKVYYWACLGKKLELNHPVTYNEKLQWLKLYDRRPEYTMMVDKYEVKRYVAEIIGEEYIIPTIGVWNSFDEIDFDRLPNQFVIKCTHDSGGLVICRDKSKFDADGARKKINQSLKKNFYWSGREWPYKNVKPRIIAEQYMEDEISSDKNGNTFSTPDCKHELKDYKFFCFNGTVKALFIATDRFEKGVETKFDFFDSEFNHLPFTNGHPNADIIPSKPKNFEKMKELASKLSADIPQVRVDFYEVNGHIYFGELTFFHWGGLVAFRPEEWDKIFGEWITLPNKR